ncbi:MAG: Major facilitator superfamily MFS_1, partial [bacterium 42_11]
MYPIYLQIVGINPLQIGILMSLFYVANLVIGPTGSIILERFSIRKASLLTSFFIIVSSIGLALTTDSKIIAFLRLLSGLGYGIGTVFLTAYQSLIVPERVRGGSFAWISVCYVSPQLFFVPIASYFIKSGLYKAYLLMFLAFSILFFLVSL